MITTKRLNKTEADLVSELFDKYRIFYKQASDINLARSFIRTRLENNESVIFVAFEIGKCVGFTQLYPKYSSARAVKNWILNDLYVEEEYRKKGIGEALIKTAMKFAKDNAATFVELSTATDNFIAQSLYETIGFKRQEPDKLFLQYKIEV